MMFSNRKYKLSSITMEASFEVPAPILENHGTKKIKLYRIQALRDIPRHNVRKGDLGGWVSDKYTLSHEDDCWIGQEAQVAIFGTSGKLQINGDALIHENAQVVAWSLQEKILIQGNAIIAGHAKVEYDSNYLYPQTSMNSRYAPYGIYGEALISGDARLRNSGVISGYVGEKAVCHNGSSVVDNAMLFGEAKISHTVLKDRVRVFGKSVLGYCQLSDRASFSTDSEPGFSFNQLIMMGDSSVSGSPMIESGCFMNESAKVFGNASIGHDSRIMGTSQVGGDAQIEPDTDITDLIIMTKTDSQLQAIAQLEEDYRKYEKMIESASKMGVKKPVSLNKDASPESLEFTLAMNRLTKITDALESYRSDIVKILTYPALNDLSEEKTLDMNIALSRVEELKPLGESQKLIDAINELERKFMVAESNAHRIAGSLLSDAQQKKTETARVLFAKATNEASTDSEKRIALKQGFKQLEGVVNVPDSAVTSIFQLAGIAQLEA